VRLCLGCGSRSVENGKLPATVGRKASGLDDEVAGLPTEYAMVDAFRRSAAADPDRIDAFRPAKCGCRRHLCRKRQCPSTESGVDRTRLRALLARESGHVVRGAGRAGRGPFFDDRRTPYGEPRGNTAPEDFRTSFGLKLVVSVCVKF